MQLRQFSLVMLTLFVGACSAPHDANTGHEPSNPGNENEAIIRQVIALIGERNLDEAFELYALDYIYHGPGGQELRGRDGIRGLWEVWLAAFPDLHSTVEDVVTEGDKIVMRWRIEGTHTGEFLGVPASNAKINVSVTGMFRVANGQLAECWDQFDGLGLMQQIGGVEMVDTALAE